MTQVNNRLNLQKQPDEDYRFPVWFYGLNMLALMIGLGFLIAFGISALYIQRDLPYDYAQLMIGAERFCYDTTFSYDQRWLYPAPFYTTFCLPQHVAPQILFWFWMVAPILAAIFLGGQRSAVLAFPPLLVHLVLGQSTWVVLPLYILASVYHDKRIPWWYGILLGLAVLKPHIALIVWLWLVWHWRKSWGALLIGAISSLVILMPAFFIQPYWVTQWLENGRGFKTISLANIALLPVQLLQLGEGQTPSVSPIIGRVIVLGFCAVVAICLYYLISKRRGKLELYDWVLIFCFANPLMHDYDLIILLPFLGNRPQRLLLAVTSSVIVWIYAGMTGNYNMSLLITGILLLARFMRLDEQFDKTAPMIRW